MNEKPTSWGYLAAITGLVIGAIWTINAYNANAEEFPFEPVALAGASLISLLALVFWKKNKAENDATTTNQNAEKIYNIDAIQDASFGNKVEDSENVVVSTQIDAGRDVHIGNKTIIYNDGRKIHRYLTNPPFNATYFIGREKDLDNIENDYQRHNRLLMLVNGEGGMGKTTLAAKYWFAHEAHYRHLAWLYAERGIGAALVSLANELGVQFDPNDDEATQVARITEGLNNLEIPCLLVFDNANDANDLEKHYVTLNRLSNCHILLTSRVRKMADMRVYEVKPLGQDDAVRLFRHHYSKLTDAELPLLLDILQAVGYNTLVTEVLAKNLTVFNRFATQYSLADLLHDLQHQGLLALKNKAVKVVYGSDSLRTAEPTDIISAMYDLAQLNEAERYLLSNLAVLPADNLPFELLKTLLDKTDEDLDTPLSSLEEKGWIEFREADSSFKISPVIQEITRKKNEERLLADCRTLVSNLVDKLHPNIIHQENYKYATTFSNLSESILVVLDTPQYNLTLLAERVGTFYSTIGNLDKAVKFFEKYREISQKLCIINPNQPYNKKELAVSYERLGSIQSILGNLNMALTFFEEETQLFKALYAANPNNIDFKNGLAISYEKLGSTYSSFGNLDIAFTFFEEYYKLMTELFNSYPDNFEFKLNLGWSNQFLGITNTSLGNLGKSLIFFEEMNKLFRELYASNPNNVWFKNGLAISYQFLGMAQSSLGNLESALTYFEDYNRLEKELYDTNPNNILFKHGIAISYEKLGSIHSSLGNLDFALTFFENYNRLEKELYDTNPNNILFKHGMAVSYEKLGSTQSSLGNLDLAFTFFEEMNKLFRELYDNNTNNVEFEHGRAVSYQFLGQTQNSLGNLEQALTFFEEYNRLSKELYIANLNNVLFKHSMSISYALLGRFYQDKKKDAIKAKTYYQQCLTLWQELVISFPNYVEFQNNLKWVEDKLKEL